VVRTALALLLLFATARADTTSIRIATQEESKGNVHWIMPQPTRPRIGLVLSGGGARGFAHLGVLKAWEQLGLPLDCVVGTSIGGTLGGLYAAGYSADSLATIARTTNWTELFSDRPARRSLFLSRRHEKDEAIVELRFDGWKVRLPRALTSGQKLSHFLADLTRPADFQIDGDFDRLPIPLRVVATDLVSGERVVIGTGSLSDALRSTAAVPLAFTPWEKDGRLLADGGLLDPIPVDVARSLKADLVVAVDVTSPLLPKDRLTDPLTLANQATTVMVLERQREQLKDADYVVTPVLDSIENSTFDQIDLTISRGYEAAWPVLKKLRAHLDSLGADLPTGPEWYIRSSHPDFLAWVATGSKTTETALKQVLTEQTATGQYTELYVDIAAHSDSAELRWNATTLPFVVRAEFHGNTILTDSQLAPLVSPLDSSVLHGPALVVASNSLERKYHRAGYPLVCADSAYVDDSGKLDITIEENIVTSMTVEGQKRTRTQFILNNLPELEGKPLSSRELASGVNALYATGLFRSVAAKTSPTPNGSELRLRVEEQDFTRMRFGAHWHEEFRAEVFAELADVNVFGGGHQVALSGMYGDRRRQVEVSAGADRLANTYLTYSLRAFYREEDWRLYVLGTNLPYSLTFHRLGARLSVGQQIKRFGLLSAGLRAEDIDDYLNPNFKFSQWNLRTFFLQADLDTYDRFPLPRSGYRQRITLERAVDWLGGNTHFTKFWAELEGVLPLGREHVALIGGAAGTSDTRLIEPERFIIGGRTTFMGLHVGEGRGDYFWRSHVALRLHNGGSRYITLQYNLGNIWTHDAKVDLLDVIHGVGTAYTFDSPAGPLDFGVGLATDRSLVAYINLGLPF
jgi:NTE family protein